MSELYIDKPYKSTIKSIADMPSWVGKELGLSNWFEINQEDINDFARITKDEQWIHVDVERSNAESPYKKPIAHGFMILSYASHIAYETMIVEDFAMGINYGLNKVRFMSPTIVGSQVRGRLSLLEVKEIENGVQYVVKIIFELKGKEKPACVAEFVARAYTAA